MCGRDRAVALEHRDEALHELGVELAPRDAAQLGDRVLRGHRRAVGFARGERVVRRADRDDPRWQGDLVADQPGRVAAAVDVLVVVEDRIGDRAVAVEPADERRPVLRMAADHRPVLVGEDLGVEDAVGQRELADVVQQPRRVDEILFGLVEAQLDGKLPRVARDGGRVACGHPIAQRERLHERGQHAELQRGEVDRARLQLVCAILRAQQRDRQVLEDQKQQRPTPSRTGKPRFV